MVTIFGLQAKEKGLDLVLDISPELPKALVLDWNRIRQVLINLIGNSIKFTESGYIKLSLNSIRSSDLERSCVDLTFSVEDTGIGIPKEQQDLILQPFYQVTNHRSSQYGGTGLGLAITKRLIEMMNGIISIESEVNKGSTIKIILKNVEIAATDALQSPSDKQLNYDAIQFESNTILIVDDIAYNRELLISYLQDYKFILIEAKNGKEAIQKAKNLILSLYYLT